MTNEERKPIVRRLLQEGQTLSQILEHLQKEKGDSLTYMELRLLLSEMPDAKLPEREFPKVVIPAAPPAPKGPPGRDPRAKTAATAAPAPAAAAPGGKVSISVDGVPAPGCLVSGFVRFGSGAKGHWMLDQYGRLGVEPDLGSDKPTQQDMKDFTVELRRILEASGGM